MAQARKPAGSPGSTGGQFDHDPKAGTGDLPGLGAFHEEYGPDMFPVKTIHEDHTVLDGMHLMQDRYRDSTMEYMGMAQARLDDVYFNDSVLAHVDMDGIRMTGGGFYGSTLNHVSMQGGRIKDVDFRKARLVRFDLTDAYCDSSFTDATLNRCVFTRTTVATPFVAPVSVTDTSFKDADLHGVEFAPHTVQTDDGHSRPVRPEFHGSIFMGGANLEGADLSSVSCPELGPDSYPNLSVTITDSTRLSGATLSRDVAAAMHHLDGTPVGRDELERRGATIAPDPDDL